MQKLKKIKKLKKPLNYFGYAFDDLKEGYNPKFLKTKEGKKEIKNNKKYNKKLRKQLEKNGFDKSECWNLHITIAQFTLPRLKYFRENTNSYPDTNIGFEGWKEIIDKMIYSFEKIIDDDYESHEYVKVQEGLDLFAKYFINLWI